MWRKIIYSTYPKSNLEYGIGRMEYGILKVHRVHKVHKIRKVYKLFRVFKVNTSRIQHLASSY